MIRVVEKSIHVSKLKMPHVKVTGNFWSHLLSQIQIITLFPKDWWYSVTKSSFSFPLQLTLKWCFLRPMRNLHESPSHNQCQFFCCHFHFHFHFHYGTLWDKKIFRVGNSVNIDMQLMNLKNTACFRMFDIVFSSWWKNIKNPIPNNLSKALFVYSVFFSLILCLSLVKPL